MTDGKKILLRSLILLGIFHAVNLFWKLLELIRYGAVVPSMEDTIIGVAFTLSLYHNLRITIS